MKIFLCVLALLSATAAVQAAPVAKSVAAPVAAELAREQNGLKVSLSKIFYFDLNDSNHPHVNVVLQNTSSIPILLAGEQCINGFDNISLEITNMNSKAFDQPIVVSRNAGMRWYENSLIVETIEPGECIVREVNLFLPIRDADLSAHDKMLYRDFPWQRNNSFQQITMRAVYSTGKHPTAQAPSKTNTFWGGIIASPLREYKFYWNRD